MKFIALFFFTFLLCVVPVNAQTDVETLVKNAVEFSRQDKIPEAVGELTKAIALQPDNAELYLRRAEFYWAGNQPELLDGDIKKAIELKPDDKFTRLTAARYLRNSGSCDKALNILNDFIFNHPATHDVFYARAHSKMCLGEWVGAYEDMATAIEQAPENNMYRTTQASIIARLGDSEKAFAAFEQLIAALVGKYQKAKNDNDKNNLGREIADIYLTRAGVYPSKGDTQAEFADLAKAVEYDPQEFRYNLRAKAYFNHRMFAEAVNDYTEAIRLSKFNKPVHLLERGDAYVFSEKYEEALKDYAEALKLDPTLQKAYDQKVAWVKQMRERIKN